MLYKEKLGKNDWEKIDLVKETNCKWNETSNYIKKVAKEFVVESEGKDQPCKEN